MQMRSRGVNHIAADMMASNVSDEPASTVPLFITATRALD
jgi:hypothetical protein